MIIKKNFLAFFSFFLPFSVFTKEIGLVNIGTQVDFISYPFYLFCFLIFIIHKKLTISISEAIVILFLISVGLVQSLVFDSPMSNFFKQLIPIIIMYFTATNGLKLYNPFTIFDNYLKLALFAAYLGILQIMLKLVGIKFLTAYNGIFIDSLALEPSHYVIMVLPAVVYMFEYKIFNWKFYILLLTLILTFKLTTILTVVTYFLIVNIKRIKNLIFIFPILLITAIYLISSNEEFLNRIESAVLFYETNNLNSIDNMTTFSFISNIKIALLNFKETFGFGVGLGGHEASYIRNSNFDIANFEWLGTNMKSAHSLAIRVISEMGIFGIFGFVYMLYKVINLKNMETKIIALACFSHFVGKFYKIGSYFDYGTMFFLAMIVVMISLDKNYVIEKESINEN